MEEHATADHPTQEPPGEQIPVSCPECNGPLYEKKEGQLARYQCFIGHAYSPQSLSEEHTEALERALWTAVRKLKERIVLHELTHVLQFSGVPWLHEHLGGLLREYLATVEVRIERGSAGALPSLPNINELVESFREGGLVALVQTREQRRIMDGVQSAMSVIEGYSEHTMDAVGEQVLPQYEGLRDAMERRRRSRSAPERVLQRLLGFDLKMRQYELGKSFCDAVANRHGIDTLNRVWDAPESLPSAQELRDPESWVTRVGDARAAA